MQRSEDLEEERRLMYVACTRAKKCLKLFVPGSVYNRASGMSDPTMASPFVLELPNTVYDRFNESYGGGLENGAPHKATPAPCVKPHHTDERFYRHCTRKLSDKTRILQTQDFGKGKIIAAPEPNKYKVNFPGFGIKTIMGDYLEML